MPREREEIIVSSFVRKTKRERLISLINKSKARQKFCRELADASVFEPNVVVTIPASLQSFAAITRALRSRGAGPGCYLISENPRLDAKELPIDEAVAMVVGHGFATIISCIPGSLAFFEGEGFSNRFILQTRVSSH